MNPIRQTGVQHNDPNFTTCELANFFKKNDPKFLMDQNKYERFKELEDTLTVYRGITQHNTSNLKGVSWTLKPQTAYLYAVQ